MGRCFVCPTHREIPEVALLDHLREMHPEIWGTGPKRWTNGDVIVFDAALVPGDFSGVRPVCQVFHTPNGKGVCMRCGTQIFNLPRRT
jgi:hypothetical protein